MVFCASCEYLQRGRRSNFCYYRLLLGGGAKSLYSFESLPRVGVNKCVRFGAESMAKTWVADEGGVGFVGLITLE